MTYLDDFVNESVTAGLRNLMEQRHPPPGISRFSGTEAIGWAVITYGVLFMVYLKSQDIGQTALIGIISAVVLIGVMPSSALGIGYATMVLSLAAVLMRYLYGRGE